jgi:hypothetical protein
MLLPAAHVLPAPQILNALGHLPHCIKYMEGLRHTMVFRFCAIPQVSQSMWKSEGQ